MSGKPRVYVAGLGMITPVGANAEMTAAAVRAGVSAFQSSGFYLDDEHPVRMARVPREALKTSFEVDSVPEEFQARQIRLLRLATLALRQLQPVLPSTAKLPLFVAGPDPLIHGEQPIRMGFLEELGKQAGVNLDPATSRIISMGRAGGLAAVDLAFRYLAGADTDFALIGGVDTFYDGGLLQFLLENDRLLVGGNTDGFIPGEGAAFLLLSRRTIALPNVGRPVWLCEPGLGTEPGHRGSKEPYRGEGLAQAVAAALDNAPTDKIQTLYSSMNGEHFFSKEHGVAIIRNADRLAESLRIEHPADCFGDLGAAFGPVATGIAALQLARAKIAAPCLVYGSSDLAARAAMVMHG